MAKARNEEKAGTQQDWPMAQGGAARQRSERYIKETAKRPAESMRGTPQHDWPIAAESADRKEKICMAKGHAEDNGGMQQDRPVAHRGAAPEGSER